MTAGEPAAEGPLAASAAPIGRPRGRRPGNPDTRSAIVEAARRAFVDHGYRGATLRRIAGEAGVDVRAIAHHFGSKGSLFGAAMAAPVDPHGLLERAMTGPPDTWATGILDAVLGVWDAPEAGPVLRRVLEAALTESGLRETLAELVERPLVDGIERRLEGPHARGRATAAAVVVTGMLVCRYLLLEVGQAGHVEAGDVVDSLGPVLEAAIRPRPAQAHACSEQVNGR